MKDKPSRAIPTITFQPTAENFKHLRPKRRKVERGFITKTINDALARFHMEGVAK